VIPKISGVPYQFSVSQKVRDTWVIPAPSDRSGFTQLALRGSGSADAVIVSHNRNIPPVTSLLQAAQWLW
jgi:hypothetical protein